VGPRRSAHGGKESSISSPTGDLVVRVLCLQHELDLLVADVTTYKAALQPDSPSQAEVESALAKMRRDKAPRVTMALVPEQALQDYRITLFPVVAIIDRAGRLRYEGVSNGYDSGEKIDRLVRRLLDEPLRRSAVR
jgi:hypothetical protein